MTYEEFIRIAESTFPELVTDCAREKFRALGPLYTDWNSKINVISRKDIGELYSHHVLHSLAIAKFLKTRLPDVYSAGLAGQTVLDLGTGGGFPGIPLAILFPECRFTLCDSVGKKIRVVSEVASGAGIENVETINARAETLTGKFDFIVSRAVAALENFLPWTKGRWSKGIVCLKGGNVLDEISEAAKKHLLHPASVSVYGIKEWLDDPYFEEKTAVFIKGQGLQKPLSEN